MNLGLKDVVDYVVRIRAQDVQFYSTLLTIFAGSILAAIVISLFTRGSKDKTTKAEVLCVLPRWLRKSRKCFFWASLLLFIAFLFFMTVEQKTKREFCTKWLANHVLDTKEPKELIQEFSSDNYALDCHGDPHHKVEPNDIPVIWLNHYALGRWGLLTTLVFPLAALFSLFLFVTSYDKVKSSTTVSKKTHPEDSNTNEVDSKQQ